RDEAVGRRVAHRVEAAELVDPLRVEAARVRRELVEAGRGGAGGGSGQDGSSKATPPRRRRARSSVGQVNPSDAAGSSRLVRCCGAAVPGGTVRNSASSNAPS